MSERKGNAGAAGDAVSPGHVHAHVRATLRERLRAAVEMTGATARLREFAATVDATRLEHIAGGDPLMYIADGIENGARLVARHACDARGVGVTYADASTFITAYSGALYTVMDFLRDPRGELIGAILSRRITPRAAAMSNITAADICPSALETERRDYELRRNQHVERKKSTAYKCKKCGSQETYLEERQTRGSDEDATLFHTCAVCGATWT